MNIKTAIIAGATLLCATAPPIGLAQLAASGSLHIDHYAGTYGVSIGSNNHYCSAELFGHGAPSITCEHAS